MFDFFFLDGTYSCCIVWNWLLLCQFTVLNFEGHPVNEADDIKFEMYCKYLPFTLDNYAVQFVV